MDRNKIEKDFCRRFNRDPKSIPVVGLSYLETISISRSFRPDLTTQSNRSMLSASPLFPAKIYPQIYIFPLDFSSQDFSWQPDNETTRSIRNDSDVTFTHGK